MFGSVCSGIEAASIAWEPLGWKAAWFSEIEPFPCALLNYWWPNTENLGDMTMIKDRILSGEIVAPDVFTGGTPCQAFSIAGSRKSLTDERGNLSVEFIKIADAIDEVRQERNEQPVVIVWENVPGVYSTSDNAFGCFLAALAGCDTPINTRGIGWTNAGLVAGPKRTVAWRTLDAQYFGLAQRRKRVFVVASACEGFDPAAVLFESEGLRRDHPPRRKAREETAGTLASRSDGGGFPGTDEACRGYIQPVTLKPFNKQGIGIYSDDDIGSTLAARDYKGAADLIIQSIHGTQDPNININHAHTLGRNNGQENVIAIPIHGKSTRHAGQSGKGSGNGFGIGKDGDPSPTITASDKHAVGTLCSHSFIGGMGGKVDAATSGHIQVTESMAIRRLMPVECERLQGFPDKHTDIPWRGKKSSDAVRYKAIGNSWAVPVAAWIARRIQNQFKRIEPVQ